MSKELHTKYLLFFLLLVIITGCSLGSNEIPNIYTSESGDKLFLHRVTNPGESFRAISLWYTGSAFNEKQIRSLNPQLRAGIRTGDFVAIPAPLLFQTEQLPEAFIKTQSKLDSGTRKTQRKTPSRQSAAKRRTEKKDVVKEANNVSKDAEKGSQNESSDPTKTQEAAQPVITAPGQGSRTDPAIHTKTNPPANSKSSRPETLEDELLKNLLAEE